MRPTLIIGIGGSGMKIGHAMKYNFYRYNPDVLKNGDIKFCFIENDANEATRVEKYYRGIKEVYNEKEIIRIGTINVNRLTTDIKVKLINKAKLTETEQEINKWLDHSIYFPNIVTEEGLAAIRQLGRVVLAVAYEKIRTSLDEVISSLKDVASKTSGKIDKGSLSIYIITGICGGTGSSMFLDVSAMIDELVGIHDSPNKKAVFINTNYFLKQKTQSNIQPNRDEYKNVQINTWALINECEFFIKSISKNQSLLGEYVARPSLHKGRTENKEPYSPFSNALIFDIYCNNKKEISLGSFYYVISDILFYAINSESNNDFASQIETNKFNVKPSFDTDIKYSTIAYRTIKFPSEEFERYFSYRYSYEIFKYGLLNKSLFSSAIEKAAESFVEKAFLNPVFGVFAKVGQDFRNKLHNYNNIQEIISNEQYRLGESGTKVLSKSEFEERLSYHNNYLKELKQEIELAFDQLPDLGFSSSFNDRPNVADSLRRSLWEDCYDIIINHGYFGIIGNTETETKGFLQNVYELLCKNYSEYSVIKNNWNEMSLLDEIENSRLKVLERLEKFKLGQKKIDDIRSELDIYHQALSSYADGLFKYFVSNIQQKILYEFAVGEGDKGILKDSFYLRPLDRYTEIKRYEKALSNAVIGKQESENSETTSLVRVYDKGRKEDTGIMNNFTKILPKEYNDTKNDVFTIYIPQSLDSFTDPLNPEGWKKETVIDDKFKRYIKTDFTEIKSIFESETNENKFLLARLGEEKEKISESINKIKALIYKRFNEKYISDSSSDIFKYLNQTFQQAYLSCSDDIKDYVRKSFNNLVYPVYDNYEKSFNPYVNIPNGLEKFVTEEFQVNPDKLVAVSSGKMPLNQIVLVAHIDDILYNNITNSKINKVIYEKRDITKFRPHLHKDWNDFPNGPFDTELSTGISLNVQGSKIELSISDIFLFSYFVEKLSELNPAAADNIFVKNEKVLQSKNGARKPPISFNKATQSFVAHKKGVTYQEGNIMKFYVETAGKSNETDMGRLFSTLEFVKAFSQLKNDNNFKSCFEDFYLVIGENKDRLGSAIKKETKAKLSDEVLKIKLSLDRNAKIKKLKEGDEDLVFIQNFHSRIEELVRLLLNIEI